MPRPIQKFYYGVVTDAKDFKQYLACDDHSGGYPFLTANPVIFYDTKFLESHRKTDWSNKDNDDTMSTFKIYEVNPFYNTVTEVV